MRTMKVTTQKKKWNNNMKSNANLSMNSNTKTSMNRKILKTAKATFAGGCFWCMEPAFRKPGVRSITAGYSGGKTSNPTYWGVGSGKSSHVEAVQVIYNPKRISYTQLLDIYWKSIDPTDNRGQFADKGSEYKTAIFYHDEYQRKQAEKSKKDLAASGMFDKPIVTPIIKYKNFYPAEEHHQGFAKKHPLRYNTYKVLSGREPFLKRVWKKKTYKTENVEKNGGD